MSGLQHAGMPRGLKIELVGQGGVGVFPPVGGDRRAGLRLGLRDRAQARVCPQSFGAGSVGGGAVRDLIGAELEKRRPGVVDEGDVQAVEPGHRGVGLVVVTVEAPARSEEEVPAAHRDRVAVDDGPDTLALHNEPESMLRVPVDRGVLARVEVLDRRPQRRRRVRSATQTRVGQRDRPPLPAAADRNQLAGPLRQSEQLRPAPQVRPRRGPWRAGHQITDLGPQRHQELLLEPPVQLVQLRCRVGLPGPILNLQGDRRDGSGHAAPPCVRRQSGAASRTGKTWGQGRRGGARQRSRRSARGPQCHAQTLLPFCQQAAIVLT